MAPAFEYRNLLMDGLNDAELDEPDSEAINHLLRNRIRSYNRLGAEGWELVTEHQNSVTYAVIATFRRLLEVSADNAAHDRAGYAPPADPAVLQPAAAQPPTDRQGLTPDYPVLQPNSASPDSFHLVWER